MKKKFSVLPPVRYFISLAQDSHFPADTAQLQEVARKWGFPLAVTEFLDQFPPDEVFKNKTDFTTRCEELEMLIEQETLMPIEKLRSPQD